MTNACTTNMNGNNNLHDLQIKEILHMSKLKDFEVKPGNGRINKEDDAEANYQKRNRQKSYGYCRQTYTILCLIASGALFILGLLMLRYKLFDIFMNEQKLMRPGLPPFELWKNPDAEVICRIHIFTVANAESFLNGTDTKIKFQEYGPILYREILEHKDVVFHENSTMTYTVHRHLEFAPDLNEPGILNATVTVPNIVLLGMAATIQDYPFTIKIGFRFMSQKDEVIVNTTVYNYLWNFTTPAFLSAKQLVPFLVAQDNGGTMYNIYKDFTDRVTVKIGTYYGNDQFFMIDKFNGKPTVPGFKPEFGDCFASLQNSSEGALYPSFLTKSSVLYYWRKTVCRPVTLSFQKEVWKGSLLGYKYVAMENAYDRYENETADCYAQSGETKLPNGLSDISKCYNDLPVAISLPHFLGREGYWNDHAEGFTPAEEEHGSYAIIEPTTGVPLEQKARSQSNMILPKLTFFNEKIERFSEKVIPMVWIEYNQDHLSPFITGMLVFTVNILPVFQYVLPLLMLIGSAFYLFTGIKRLGLERKLRLTERDAHT